nr:unnamed protein product [Trichobilharzia regenti]
MLSHIEDNKPENLQDDGGQMSSTHGDITHRICSDLENMWRSEHAKNVSDYKENLRNQTTTTTTTTRDVGNTITPKQLVDYSLRQIPGLSRPSKQTMDHLIVGNDIQTNLNSSRIWFTARLLVFDSSDIVQSKRQSKYTSDMEWTNSISSFALRNFIGIGFPHDSTIALYEDHKTGVSSKPLPFLRRSVYHCAWGSRRGQTYLPEVDLFPGAVLFIHYSNEFKTPNSLKQYFNRTGSILRILITGVDRPAKRKALESELSRQGVPKDQWYSVMAKLHVARLLIRPRNLMQLYKLQCVWRRELRKRTRPIEAFLNLHLYYRNALKDNKQLVEKLKQTQECSNTNTATAATTTANNINNVILSEEELCVCKQIVRKILEDGLIWFRLPEINEAENLNLLWNALEDSSGHKGIPHFSDYISLVFGELPEVHRALLRRVFLKMDPNLLGHIQLLDIKRFYNAPKWAVNQLGNNIAHSQMDLLNIFEKFISIRNCLEYIEFENYYQAISIALGECPVDQLKSDASYMDLCSLLPSSECAQNYFLGQETVNGCDTFKRMIEDSWCI